MTTMTSDTPAYQFLRRLVRAGFGPIGAVIFGVLAVAAGGATYAAFTDLLPASIDAARLLPILLWTDIAVVITLIGLIAARLATTIAARRRGVAGARLHVRLVLLFVAMAVGPTVLVSTFAGYWISTRVNEFLNERVRRAVDNSVILADAYIRERGLNFEYKVAPLVRDLRRQGPQILLYQEKMTEMLTDVAVNSDFTEVAIVDQTGAPLARGRFLARERTFAPPNADQIAGGLTGLTSFSSLGDRPSFSSLGDRLSILVLLFSPPADPIFLYVIEPINPRLLPVVNSARLMKESYTQFETEQTAEQVTIAGIFFIIVLVLLLLAIWIGLVYAERLSRPITELVGAAERVRAGDLKVRVEEPKSENEIGMLSRAFNRMTSQLDDQRRELTDASAQIDGRRRLIEAVLSGVSAAVVSLDREGKVELANRSALDLLDVQQQGLVGSSLVERLPAIGGMLELGRLRPTRVVQEEIEFRRRGETMTLLTRVAVEKFAGAEGTERVEGFVVTFDDITELLSAQRKAAWADVARRIAHEIKNPLTPIQLSAERLKRKYTRQIVEDPETFAVCTDTIIRQVGDIGRMVDEFSSFARMPRPVLQNEDLKEICLQSVFLQRNAQPQIDYTTQMPEHGLSLPIDRRQIGQALTNLLKNAAEAIEGRDAKPGQNLPPGSIWIELVEQGDNVTVTVEDNGRGLPAEHRARLTEPYVTTRAKGTGLGLAIVKKIMEDHGGYLVLDDREGGGARVSLVFRRTQAEALRTSDEGPFTPKKTA